MELHSIEYKLNDPISVCWKYFYDNVNFKLCTIYLFKHLIKYQICLLEVLLWQYLITLKIRFNKNRYILYLMRCLKRKIVHNLKLILYKWLRPHNTFIQGRYFIRLVTKNVGYVYWNVCLWVWLHIYVCVI